MPTNKNSGVRALTHGMFRPVRAPSAAPAILLASLLAGAGCVGDIGGKPPGSGGPGPGNPGPGGPGGPGAGPGAGGNGGPGGPGGAGGGGGGVRPGDPLAAGPMPVRRLTAHEYENTLRDLLGAGLPIPKLDASADRDPGFGFRRPGVVTTLESERLRDAAESLAAAAVRNVATLVPCAPAAAADEAPCARRFVEQFGARAYRRPVLPAEIDRLMALYQNGRGPQMLAFKDAIALVLEAMLQSSAFLYRWELGPQAPLREGAWLRLNQWEVASRLSYFLWSTMPDKGLFDAAAANQLDTPAQIEAQVRRMLRDPKARDGVAGFFDEWLDLESLEDRTKDPALYPEFNDNLKASMAAETRAFVNEVMFTGDGKLATLLGASFSVVDESLAKLYGATGVTGATPKRVNLDPRQRSGLLTQASFLSITGSPEGSNPVERGKEIYLHFLCRELPPPPPEVPPPKPASAGGTTRQRFEEHGRQPCAQSCHLLFDGFGYAFESYDGIGRYRTTDNNLPVDTRGQVELDGVKHDFTDARSLGEIIAASPEAQRCFATQWLRFAFRRPEVEADTASLNAAMAALTRSSGDVRELLVALATSRTFRYRGANPGEVLP
jgi:hypothetical protein